MADKTRSRRQWGTVITRRNEEGQIITYQARYVNPLDHSKKVSRNFGPDYLAEAYKWLDKEHYYVTLHDKGIRPWVHPSHREPPDDASCSANTPPPTSTRTARRTARNYAAEASASSRTRSTSSCPISATWRCPGSPRPRWTSGTPRQASSTSPARSSTPATRSSALTAASKPQDDDSPALLAANPCNFPTLRKPSARRNQTPLTKDEIDRLVTLFPEYYQLCIRLSLLVGGLRIGEICGLQLRDIDLDHGLLYVRHSVDRGPADLGSYQLSDVKAPRSNRVVPIPASAVAMIREHIEKFCPDREPGTMLFHSIRDASKLLGPTTIQRQFRTARKKIGRPDITFHSLRSTHATMFMLEGGTLRETMDKLGHVDVDVAINCYQRIVPRHQREVAELLAYHYMSSDDPPPCAPKSTNENRNSPTSRTTSPNSGSGSRPVWRRTGHEVQQSSKPCSPQSRSGSGPPPAPGRAMPALAFPRHQARRRVPRSRP